jgi:dolichol-phosphate mannosyltransferase
MKTPFLIQFWGWKRLHQFFKFCLVGGSGLLVDMGVLFLLADTRCLVLNVTIAKFCAAETALVNNFIWNEFWTFKRKSSQAIFCQSLFRRFLAFNAICGIGIGLAVLLLHCFHNWCELNLYLSNLLAIFLVTLWNYGMNARFNWHIMSKE